MCDDSQTITLPAGSELVTWLEAQAVKNRYQYLLAHLDDGIIWGRFTGGRLELAGKAFPEVDVELRASTLQQMRLFGAAGECLVWRVGEQRFKARQIDESANPLDASDPDWLDTKFLLWGEGEQTKDGFTLMREGRQGLLHAAPEKAVSRHVYLLVRHYIHYDSDGQAAIAGSRLMGLEVR